LAALSGPRHGGAARALGTLLDDTRRIGTGAALRAWLDRGAGLPGFGHPLYPGGDPRADAMLDGLEVPGALADLRRQVFDQTGEFPNCDFALAAMVEPLGLPEDAPFRLFLLARSVGWCAHAMEQARSNSLIRPRARYDGPLPD
ncbi:citrate/2-methylcitrate synthase, partial [Zavarzinia sp.]|uniref:citrate/2-methylcitrate synthase n=1 Tax=Zavarzinia sp. TaxID=2027920 RepID=UPI00356A319C